MGGNKQKKKEVSAQIQQMEKDLEDKHKEQVEKFKANQKSEKDEAGKDQDNVDKVYNSTTTATQDLGVVSYDMHL